jgi:hypothetical protein
MRFIHTNFGSRANLPIPALESRTPDARSSWCLHPVAPASGRGRATRACPGCYRILWGGNETEAVTQATAGAYAGRAYTCAMGTGPALPCEPLRMSNRAGQPHRDTRLGLSALQGSCLLFAF